MNLRHQKFNFSFLLKIRVITTDDGLKKAKDLEILFMEVSAKSGLNIQNLFKTIASNLPGVNELSQLGQSILPTSHGMNGIINSF